MRAAACVLCLVGVSGAVATEQQPLVCFGNEPSWSVDLTEPGVARFATPDQEAVTFRGQATRHAFLPESLWRGSPAAGRDLVVWLQDSTCTDNMSGNQLPVTTRVSAARRAVPVRMLPRGCTCRGACAVGCSGGGCLAAHGAAGR